MTNVDATVVITVDAKKAIRGVAALETALAPQGLHEYLLLKVGPFLRVRAKERFAQEGDDATGRWQPLSGATISIRGSKGYPPGPINRRTGELERYITGGRQDIDHFGDVATLTMPGDPPAGGSELEDKVKTAQLGRDNPFTVSRPVLGLSAIDLSEAIATMNGHLHEYFGRFG